MSILAGLESFTLTSWMCQCIYVLINDYCLPTAPKKKLVIGLYLLLYPHRVHKDQTCKFRRIRSPRGPKYRRSVKAEGPKQDQIKNEQVALDRVDDPIGQATYHERSSPSIFLPLIV